jgi:hypothetical protein
LLINYLDNFLEPTIKSLYFTIYETLVNKNSKLIYYKVDFLINLLISYLNVYLHSIYKTNGYKNKLVIMLLDIMYISTQKFISENKNEENKNE